MNRAGIGLIAAAASIAVLMVLNPAGFPEALGIALIDLLRVIAEGVLRSGREWYRPPSPAADPGAEQPRDGC